MDKMDDVNAGSMQIILHAGNARSCVLEALNAIENKKQDIYDSKLENALAEMKLAHRAHSELLKKLSLENRMEDVDLLLVHAEGHLSSTEVAVQLIGTIGRLYKWKEEVEKNE